MRVRGRITVVLAVALLVLGIDRLVSIPREPAAPVPPAPVVVGPPPPSLVPAEVLSRIPLTRELLEELEAATPVDAPPHTLVEVVSPPASRPDLAAPLRVEYSLDPRLMHRVFTLLRHSRAKLGHVILMDPQSGRLLAYASTDRDRFPPDHLYPAASLMKIITTAALLHHAPEVAEETCRYVGNPYRLTRKRLNPPRRGRSVSFRRALATSNNQCFAQLAVHRLGRHNLLGAIDRFGWSTTPAPTHPAGRVELGDEPFDLGKLATGLAGIRIAPLHAAQLAATLANGRRTEPYWITRVQDGHGRNLLLPRQPALRVMTPDLARQLREMLVETTLRGTARRAFRTRRGPLLGRIRVAGKTGSLNGDDPHGRYEWFVGVAPSDAPTIAVAVVLVQGWNWWATPAQVAAEVLKMVFCPKGVCSPEASRRWLERPRSPSVLARAGS